MDTKFLAACKSIDKRGKGKTVLAADYTAIHAAMGDKAVLAMLSGPTGIGPAAPAPSSPELVAPTIPIALPPTAAVGSVTHNWLPSCDKHDGTNVATGIASYTPTPTVGGGSEILGVPTAYAIGTASPAGTYTRNGVDMTLTCGGTAGLEGTSDVIYGQGWACTSSQYLAAVVNSISSSDYPTFPSDYSGAGVIFRDSTAVGSKFLALYYAQNKYVYVKWRGTLNGAVSQAYAISDGSLGLLYIQPNGDGTFSCYRQTAGQARQLIKTTTTAEVSLASTGIGTPFCFSLTSNAVTAVFTQVALASATPITKTTSTAVPVALTLLATDVAGNSSAASVSVTATPLSASNRRFRPGDGVRASKQFSSETVATMKSRYDLMRTHPELTCGMAFLRWSELEPTQGVDDYTTPDALIAYLNNTTTPGRFGVPKQFSFDTNFVKFVQPAASPYSGTMPMPQYVIDNGWTIVRATSGFPGYVDVYPDFSIAACRNAYIAFWQRLGTKYNGNTNVEMVSPMGETTQATSADMLTIMAAVVAAFPNTNVFCGHNYLSTGGPADATFKNQLVAMLASVGGPDILPPPPPGSAFESNGQCAFRGVGSYNANGGYGLVNYGSIDSRGVVPNCLSREYPFNAAAVAGDNSQLCSFSHDQKCTHRYWDFDNDAGDYQGHASFANLLTNIAAYPVWPTYPTASGY